MYVYNNIMINIKSTCWGTYSGRITYREVYSVSLKMGHFRRVTKYCNNGRGKKTTYHKDMYKMMHFSIPYLLFTGI